MLELCHSIIIPIFNAENTLKACVESILSQDVANYEIILVDDGSTDSSPDICDRLCKQDDRIKVIHNTNEGVSEARNTGINVARGEWISFVDADDIVLSAYLSEFDKVETKADLTYFGSHFVSDDACDATYTLPEKTFCGREEIESGILLLKKNTVNYGHYGYTWNKFFRTSIIRKYHIHFVKDIDFREDEIFTNDYISHCKSLMTLPYIGYQYRYTHSGLSWKTKSAAYWQRYYEKSLDFLKKVSNKDLQSYEYPKVVKACFMAFESEKDRTKYLMMLDEMLGIVREYGDSYPYVGKKDYYSSILDYYKDSCARRRIDTLKIKKRIKLRLGL